MQFSFHFRTKVPSVYAKGTKYFGDNQMYLDFCFHKNTKDMESKYYLPIYRMALNRLFKLFFALLTFLRLNSDFPYLKLRLWANETSDLL